MRLTPWLLGLVITSTACAARPAATYRPLAPGDWSLATATAPGSRIRVEAANGRTAMGEWVRIDASDVVLLVDGAMQSHSRRLIRRMFLRTERTNVAKQGFLIGAAAGGLQGSLLTKSNRGLFAALLGAGWGGIGACIGALQGLGTEETLIYSARAAPPMG